MKNKVTLITSITGQDGAYLAEFSLEKGYQVPGIKGHSLLFNTDLIDHLYLGLQVNDRKMAPQYGDPSNSDGALKTLMGITRPPKLGWKYKVGVWEGLAKACDQRSENRP